MGTADGLLCSGGGLIAFDLRFGEESRFAFFCVAGGGVATATAPRFFLPSIVCRAPSIHQFAAPEARILLPEVRVPVPGSMPIYMYSRAEFYP